MNSKKVKSPNVINRPDFENKPAGKSKLVGIINGGHKPTAKTDVIGIPANVENA